MKLSIFLLALILVYLAITIGISVKRGQSIVNRLPLPPGPPADPLIGHARSMPHLYPWKTFAEWGRRWGGLVYVHVLGKSMIIINDLAVARELMDKRGSIYSDRPRYVLFREMMGWDRILAFLPYGDKFRKHRRMVQHHFNSQAVVRFRALQRAEIYILLENLLKLPKDFDRHIKRAIAGTLTMVIFGHSVISDNDDYVNLVEKTNTLTLAPGAPGTTPPDFVPALRYMPLWLPGTRLLNHAMRTRELVQAMLNVPYNFVKRNRALGIAKPSLLSYLLDEYEKTGVIDLEHEEDIKGVGAVIYSAGFETSQATLLTFFLAMTRHPEIMERAQDEIEHVIGQDRMPTIEDRWCLPYVDCILKECLRWNPPVPLGIPHRVLEEDDYRGMRIPKGTTIVANIWQMMRDERYYPDPEEFNPNRFSRESEMNIPGVDIESEDYDPLNVVFGFGRRTCPGRFFAESSLWLAMASILAAFDIKRPLDAGGSEYIPEAVFTTGTGSQPKDFMCRILPRSKKYEQMIEHEQQVE